MNVCMYISIPSIQQTRMSRRDKLLLHLLFWKKKKRAGHPSLALLPLHDDDDDDQDDDDDDGELWGRRTTAIAAAARIWTHPKEIHPSMDSWTELLLPAMQDRVD